MKGLIETQFTFRFKTCGWSRWIDRFDNDRFARRVTLTRTSQGHSIYATPSERDFYQLCVAVCYGIAKRLPKQIKFRFKGWHDDYGISWAPGGRNDQTVTIPVPFMYTQPS